MKNKFPIKILYFITSLDMGGAEQLLLLTLKNLNRQRFKPFVCCLYAGKLANEIEGLGIEVIDLKIKNKLDLSILFKFYNLLKKEKFDIVHTHLFHSNIIGRIMARLCHVPIVISTLHYAFSYNGNFGIILERLTAKLADRIIVVSDAVRNFCINEIKIPQERLQLIYNGVDLNILDEVFINLPSLREELSLNNDFLVGCIGRFAEVKGQRYLLKAIAEVIKVHNKIKFLLIGSGPLEKELRDLTKALGISDNIIFLDSRRDIPQMMHSVDLYVVPSLQEGLSITLLEALAMEKPTIATTVGGNPEVIIHEESGILIPPKDHKAIAKSIIRLFENKDKAKELGIKGRLRVIERFNIKENVSKTQSLYENLIEEQKERR